VPPSSASIGSAPTGQKLLRIRPTSARVDERAEAAVEQAFETVFSSQPSIDERCRSIELGDNLGPTMEAAGQRYAPGQALDMSVDYVRFLSEDEAEVQFTLWLRQFGSSGMRQTGHAVRVGDEWKVSRETWCGLVSMIGIQCPPPGA
jgi:hypothetical protein